MSTATLPAGVALLAASSLLCPARAGADGELPLRPSTVRTVTSLTHSLRTEIPTETPLGDPYAPVHAFFRTPHVSSDVLAALRSSWLSRVVERDETFAPSMYLLPVDDAREYEELVLHMDTKSCTASFFLNRLDAVCNVFEYLEKYFPKPVNFQGFGVVPNILLGTNWAEGPATVTVPSGRGSTQHRSPCDNRLVSKHTLELVRSGIPLRFTEFATTILDCTMSLSEGEFHGTGLACRILNSAYGDVEALRSRARMSLYRHNEHREPRGLKDRASLAIRTLDAECFSSTSTSVFPRILQVLVKDDQMLGLLGLRLEASPPIFSTPIPLQSVAAAAGGITAADALPPITEGHRHRLALALFLVLESFPIVAFASRKHVGIAEDYIAFRSKQQQQQQTPTRAASIFEEYADAFALAVVKFAPLVFPLEVHHSRTATDTSVGGAVGTPTRTGAGAAAVVSPRTPPPMPQVSSRQFTHPSSANTSASTAALPLSPRRRDGPPAVQFVTTAGGLQRETESSPPAPIERRSTLPIDVITTAARQHNASVETRVESPRTSPRRGGGPTETVVTSSVSIQVPLPARGPTTGQRDAAPVAAVGVAPSMSRPFAPLPPSSTDDLTWWPSNGNGVAVSRSGASSTTAPSYSATGGGAERHQLPSLASAPPLPPAAAPQRSYGAASSVFGLDDLRSEFENVMKQQSPRRSPPRASPTIISQPPPQPQPQQQHQQQHQQHTYQPTVAPSTYHSTYSPHQGPPNSTPYTTALQPPRGAAVVEPPLRDRSAHHHDAPNHGRHGDQSSPHHYVDAMAPARDGAQDRRVPPMISSTAGYMGSPHVAARAAASQPLRSATSSSMLSSLQSGHASSVTSSSFTRSISPSKEQRRSSPQASAYISGRTSPSSRGRSDSCGRDGGAQQSWRSPLKQTTAAASNRMRSSSQHHHHSSTAYSDPATAGRMVRLDPVSVGPAAHISVQPHAANNANGYYAGHNNNDQKYKPVIAAAPSPAPQVQHQRYLSDNPTTTSSYAHHYGYGSGSSGSAAGNYRHQQQAPVDNKQWSLASSSSAIATNTAAAKLTSATGYFSDAQQQHGARHYTNTFSVVVSQPPPSLPPSSQPPHRALPVTSTVRRSAELAALEDLIRKERGHSHRYTS